MNVINIKSSQKQIYNLPIQKINIKKNDKNILYFSKSELKIILNFYSKQVSKGLWRDYAIDNLDNETFFSIYKHSYDKPVYQIIKINKKRYYNKTCFLIRNFNKILDKNDSIDRILLKFEKKLMIRKLK